jgi:hypothetical protein
VMLPAHFADPFRVDGYARGTCPRAPLSVRWSTHCAETVARRQERRATSFGPRVRP